MFGWLADLIVKTPVQGGCSCCEGRKKELQRMQKAIIGAEDEENLSSDEEAANHCCCRHECGKTEHECECKNHHEKGHHGGCCGSEGCHNH
ncbi:MAG: hypothetical protein ACI4OW_02870 [Alphaproteobacteria bacterium]